MRKAVLFICMALAIGMVSAYGADMQVSVSSYPARMFIKSGEILREIDTMGNELLNYKGRAYVPLRVFTESIGAEVKFSSATSKVPYNIIDIVIDSQDMLFGYKSVSGRSSTEVKSLMAEIYPSQIHLVTPEYDKTIDVEAADIIQYNQRAYIPLRVLSESMGFDVKFEAAAGFNQYNIITLEIPGDSDLPYESDDGSVSFSVSLKEIFKDYGSHTDSYYEATGLMRINEDIPDNKFIIIEITDGKDNTIGYFDTCVSNIYSQPLQKGDLRRFTAVFSSKPGYGYRANLYDRWTSVDDENEPKSEQSYTGVAKGRINAREHSVNPIYDIYLAFINGWEKDISIKSAELVLEIVRMNDGLPGDVVHSVDIKIEESAVTKGQTMRYVLPSWDGKDSSGLKVSAGEYGFILRGPESLKYQDGSGRSDTNIDWNGFGCPVITIE